MEEEDLISRRAEVFESDNTPQLHELLLRTGLGWHPKPNWDVSLAFDVPLYQDYEGTQLGLDYRTFIAVGLRF